MKRLENKGITLVALVVTIIVLIILAGVSISLVLGQDGVVQKAKAGRDNYAEAARLENEQLANVDAFSMNIGEVTPPIEPVTGTITNMTNGEIEISATVNLGGDIDVAKTKYVFTTNNTALGTTDETLYKDGTLQQASGTVKATKKAGAYYLHVLATDINGGKTEIISEGTATSTQGIKNFAYTGNAQEIGLTPGRYKLEVWGAQGGSGDGSVGANKGGYAVGTVNLVKTENLYVYVGQQGDRSTNNSNFTFGGGGRCYSSSGRNMGRGGGASDIRVNSDSLYARLIVAGGGGGSDYASSYSGGAGGGTSGITGSYGNCAGTGGTISSGGTVTGNSTSWGGTWYRGTFGQGGYGTSGGYMNGGGGGWYGGGASGPDGTSGGGSGWVYTESNYNSWRSGNATDANQYLLKDHPEYYLTNAQTIAGNTSFTAPGGSNETGHSGNGYARITALD